MRSAPCDPSLRLPLRSMMAITANNTYYTVGGEASMELCGWGAGGAWAKLQAGVMEAGSKVRTAMPSAAEIVAMGRKALGV